MTIRMREYENRNVITTADLKQKVDAPRFVDYQWGMYDLESYGGRCGYVKDDLIQGRVTVFLTGKMISTGAVSVRNSIKQLEHTMELLVKNAFATKIVLVSEVRNIVATMNLERLLDLKEVVVKLPMVSYEPEQFPGAILRTTDGPVCPSIRVWKNCDCWLKN